MDSQHLDPRLSSEQRAALLLPQLTIEEKCAQLVGMFPWHLITPEGNPAPGSDALLEAPPGHIAGLTADDPDRLAQLQRAIQRRLVEETRLGIPAIVHQEGLNGFLSGGHTIFPTPIGLATTWSPDLVQRMAAVISSQMLRAGLRQALSPVLDVAVDPRWGRVHETYGEDPYLAAALAVAYVRGLQTDDLRGGVIATAKHFLGYGLPEGGVNLSATDIGPRRLRDVYAYPFEAAIQLAGLGSVMNSYSEIDGIPVGASRAILVDLLRETLGFTGFVSSDYSTTHHFVDRQKVALDAAEAGRLAVAAGLDVELPEEFGYGAVLAAEVRRGAVPVEQVDACVERVLRAKFALGLFEDPYPRDSIDLAATRLEGDEVSAELARRSVVLLANDGALPLQQGPLRTAVIGPHASAAPYQFPTYTYPAFREMLIRMSRGELGNAIGVEPAAGDWIGSLYPPADSEEVVRDWYGATSLADELRALCEVVAVETGTSLTGACGAQDVERSLAAAEAAEVIVLALGGASLWFNSERTEGEASDSADIGLPPGQVELATALIATGKPVIVVLFQGRGYALPEVIQGAAAVVVAPYGGPFGPRAVAEVLFGVVTPSGKLPYSVPRHSGQVPVYHHQRNGSGQRNPFPPAVPQHYLDMPATPAYPFGHGLSYTTFELSDLQHDPVIDTTGSLTVAVTVTNTGSRAGAAVVQLYLRLRSSGLTRPAQQLAGFARVPLEPAQASRVAFVVDAAQLGCTGLSGTFGVASGPAELFIGLDSDDSQLAATFVVEGPARELTSPQRAFLSRATVQPLSTARLA